MKNHYVCKSADGKRYETFDNIKEFLENIKTYGQQEDLQDEGDEISLEQALYRVVDGDI